MFFNDIDLIAVLVAALIPLALGSFWYSPLVFGNHWRSLAGVKDAPQARREFAIAFLGSFCVSLVMSFVLAVLIVNMFVIPSAGDGIAVGFWAGVGFVATTMLPEYLFGGSARPYRLYILTVGYHLLSLIVMGALLGLWL